MGSPIPPAEWEHQPQTWICHQKAAEDWDADNHSRINRGEFVAPAKGRIKMADLAPGWLERKKATTEPSHSRMLDSAWRVHVEPAWGAVAVNKVTATGVKTGRRG
jgi:hypothetical protein